MDLPAILAFDSYGTTRYLALNKWDKQTLFLTDGDRRMSIFGPDLLKSGWKWAYIPWKDFAGISGTIPRDASGETILTIKMLLRKMGFSEVPLTADYGNLTKGVVEQIQNRGGIPVDGLVGPATKIIIYNNLEQYIAPRIGATAKTLG
jgi:general secretion pathway protein A